MAYFSEEKRKDILDKKGLPSLTEKTITNRKKLEEELCKVREQGFALDREENEKDVRCIAAPIRNYQGRVIASISISSPAYRTDIDQQNHSKKVLLQTSKNISKRLGYNI